MAIKVIIYCVFGFCLIAVAIGKSSSKPDYVSYQSSPYGGLLGNNHGGHSKGHFKFIDQGKIGHQHIPSLTPGCCGHNHHGAHNAIQGGGHIGGIGHSGFRYNQGNFRILTGHNHGHHVYQQDHHPRHHCSRDPIRFLGHGHSGYRRIPGRVRVISRHPHGGYDSRSNEHVFSNHGHGGYTTHPRIIRVIRPRGYNKGTIYGDDREHNGFNGFIPNQAGIRGFQGHNTGNRAIDGLGQGLGVQFGIGHGSLQGITDNSNEFGFSKKNGKSVVAKQNQIEGFNKLFKKT